MIYYVILLLRRQLSAWKINSDMDILEDDGMEDTSLTSVSQAIVLLLVVFPRNKRCCWCETDHTPSAVNAAKAAARGYLIKL